MTNYLVYDKQVDAQKAADDLWAKYGPTVHETDLTGKPSKNPQVTQRWSDPMQRKDGTWIIQDNVTLKPDPINAAKATETFDPAWFDSAILAAAVVAVDDLSVESN